MGDKWYPLIAMDSLDLNIMLDNVDEKSPKSCSTKPLSRITEKSEIDSIRSTAVVTYSAAKYPALFSQLAPFTNLNLAPSNWLRNAHGLRPNFTFSPNRPAMYKTSDSPLFSSFQMADSHLHYVGDIDVISDAENLKKLLKAPFSKAHVSMAVHRFGNTILLEHFDINHESLKPHGWKWFKEMYKELTRKRILKKKLPSAQHERLMLSKFLYYSLRQDDVETTLGSSSLHSADALTVDEVLSAKHHLSEKSTVPLCDKTPKSSEENSLIPADLQWKYWTPDDAGTSQCFDIRHTFERTIFWTFEDLQMLLGTNMPIFGAGEYPAVSLRLLDYNKPINILTGIDYWLDNLICNVPEVVMCFHVNGIVQKYEVIKTEEIPKITAPKFRPQVVKDIAQNILSFLKSKCTKEGHTYWLFRGSNDDVVKLYDLTSLCNKQGHDELRENEAQNPFIISVATLLYKMAVNLMKQQRSSLTEQSSTIKKLLQNCVKLLEQQDQLAPIMLDAALCMLSTLYLPDLSDEIELSSSNTIKVRLHSNSISEGTEKPTSATAKTDLDSAEIAVISSVNDLSIPEKFKSDRSSSDTMKHSREESGNYSIALSYILKGLDVFNQFNSKETDKSDSAKCRKMLFVHMQMIRNVTLIYYGLAKHAYSSQSYGKSLQCIRVALLSYEYLEKLMDVQLLQGSSDETEDSTNCNDYDVGAVFQGTTPPEYNLLLPRLLCLCGDIQMLQCQWSLEQSQAFQQEYEKLCQSDLAVINALDKNYPGVGEKYKNAIRLSTQYEEILISCHMCFETALDKLVIDCLTTAKSKHPSNQNAKDHSRKRKDCHATTDNETTLRVSLNRKLGDVANEQGAIQLKAAKQLVNSSSGDKALEKQREIWKVTYSYFETALNCFVFARDNTNQALVLSNLGQLMRVCAKSTALSEDQRFTSHEQQLFDSAIEYYKKAIALQKQVPKNRKATSSQPDKHAPSIADNLSWELSLAYFALAERLQEHPPSDMKAQDEIEKIIIDMLTKSQKCCVDIWKKTEKRSVALYHCAKIHACLASLYYYSSGNTEDMNKKRKLRNLAEIQYEKSCSIFGKLADGYSCEYLRVILEWLSLKEKHMPFVTNQAAKLKLVQEGIKVMMLCTRPLTVLAINLKDYSETFQNSESSVDPKKTVEHFDIGSVEDWITLTSILGKILTSFFLALLKITSPSSNAPANSSKKKSKGMKFSTEHSTYKQIYYKSLRLLQKSETDSATKLTSLLKRVEAFLEVIEDLK